MDGELAPSQQPTRYNALFGASYHKLRSLARGYLRRERPDHTLQPTALVHEAYAALSRWPQSHWRGERHLQAAAARSMRRRLINHAQRRNALKRGQGHARVPLHTVSLPADEIANARMSVTDVLARLGTQDPTLAQLVEIHVIEGATLQEAAQRLDLSMRTAERRWAFARAWLRIHLAEGDANL